MWVWYGVVWYGCLMCYLDLRLMCVSAACRGAQYKYRANRIDILMPTSTTVYVQ